MQGDVPLSHEVLAEMSKEERFFWIKFMTLAQEEIKNNQGHGNEEPYAPSAPLQGFFETAVKKHDGKKYCQVQQLISIFNFAENQ